MAFDFINHIISHFGNKSESEKNYFQQVNKKASKLMGNAGAISKELLKNQSQVNYYGNLYSKLVGNKKTMEDVLAGGLKEFFYALMPGKTAEDFCQLVLRLPNFTYNPSSYRRSYRSANPYDYAPKILILVNGVFFNWEKFDLLTYLKMSGSQIKEQGYECPNTSTISQLIGLEIDRGNREIINVIKELILSDNNIKLVGYELMRGIAMSKEKELHDLMKKLLLAAKLQEGLRQAILETADDGTKEYFTAIIECVLENNLLRFSSCLRAVDVWMGLGYDYSDHQVLGKMLKLGASYLRDETARQAALDSMDVTQMYGAMWAESVHSIQNLFFYINKYIQGEKYQKMVSLYFLFTTYSPINSIEICSNYLNESDLDILTLIINNYHMKIRWLHHKDRLAGIVNEFPHLGRKETRDKHFESFSDILEQIPKNGHTINKKPFDWCSFTLTRSMVFDSLMVIAAYDFDEYKIEKLMEMTIYVDSDSRRKFLEYFMSDDKDANNKAFLFSCLSDKSMTVRIKAVKQLKEMELNEVDILQIEELFTLKTGQIRQGALEILNGRDKELILKSVHRLISDKEENKRLAALDMLTTLKKQEQMNQEELKAAIAIMPLVTEREAILVKNLTDTEQVHYSEENGFGLYDVGYYPTLSPVVKDKIYNLDSFKKIPLQNLTKVMESLLQLIEIHKDYSFKVSDYGSESDEILGGLNWLPVVSGSERNRWETKFDDYVLSHVWLDWEKQNHIDLYTLIKLNYFISLFNYRDSYILEYELFACELIKKIFGYDDINKFLKWLSNKKFNKLAKDIVVKLLRSKDGKDSFKIYHGILADAFLTIPKNSWLKEIQKKKNNPYYNVTQQHTLADTQEIRFFIYGMNTHEDKDMFREKFSLLSEIGRASNERFKVLTMEAVAEAVSLGIADNGELCRAIIHIDRGRSVMNYTGNMNDHFKKTVEKYPVITECIQNVVNRVIEIELKRGDTITPVSHLASNICQHRGASTFAELLVAMGSETLVRGYMYGSHYSKKEVLSKLLKTSIPNENDTAETLRACLRGRVTDKRLLEAAMYAPAWINIIQDYVGWEGLKCGAWYFHAHTRNSYSAEFETEVARFSPIDKEDFQRGAFDISWFKEAYDTLGEKRFKILYDCAKYISEGASHRRAQLFADAVLGKLSVEGLEKDIRDKRNKDLLLSYSLVPFADNKMAEALRRFEFINEYLKKSKEFGAQRQASEKQAAQIALENLARNLGFADVLRFNWKMEMQKIELIQHFFKPHIVEDTTLYLEMDETGMAKLVVQKDGKVLKSLPKTLKGNEYAQSIGSVKTSLKQQFSRAKVSLEKAMENQDEFTFDEVSELLGHPVIAPIIKKLVFKTGESLGFLKEFGVEGADGEQIKLNKGDILTIAHCYDLYILEKWQAYQRFVFENKLLQPFKQIFRELYIVNEDERAERTISRRYAGHQIQPKKTVALLKSRSWTVDYESGLQKVYYKENVVATMYALADWFSPAEVEAPTLETVRFYNRKSYEPIDMQKINPILFSEVMRDVDLVVSVAHVGGVDPLASHSTIEMRSVIVKEAMSLIKISNVIIDDRFARIKGVHGEYSVHLGSGIAHQMGHGALHIIPVHSQHRGRIFLPFLDEDPKTAEIVSKILLLAEDSKIKDPTVMYQIK